MKRLFIPTAVAILGFGVMACGVLAQAPPGPLKLQNPAVLAAPKAENPIPLQAASPQGPAIIREQETVIIRGPYELADSPMGDIELDTPGPMSADSVYIDGAYVGVAGDISDIQIAPGPHQVMLPAPDGTAEYRDVVGVAVNQTNDIIPIEALNNGTNAASAEYYPPASVTNLAPPAPAYVSQPQPASEQGDLRLREAYTLRRDAVFVDGSYVGTARNLRDLELTSGTHEIALCAPNGNTDFNTQVGISRHRVTHLRADLSRPTLNG